MTVNGAACAREHIELALPGPDGCEIPSDRPLQRLRGTTAYVNCHATPARKQSCICRKPIGLSPSATTKSEVMPDRFINPNASAARAVADIVFGLWCMTASTV